ncbi:MAG: AAA family ATPase [Dehalococcoidia bacterium]|nr:MAG: AAA family ATPase [Dehalococcoidia bacterium]
MQQNSTVNNPLLAIVGMTGSGKSSIAHHLERKGWHIIRFGGITMRELESRGLPVNETNERSVREELRETHGMDAFARLSLAEIEESLSKRPTVIDGLYSWSEYKFLRQHLGNKLKLVAIYTTRSVRYARLSQRQERPLTFEEAEQRDFAEIENVEKAGPIAIADYTIINNGTEEELLAAVDALLSDLIPD